MYALDIPRKWKFTKVMEVNKMEGQIAVSDDGELPVYIPTVEGIYRSFRDQNNERIVVKEGEAVIFRNVIKGGYLQKCFIKESVEKEELANPERLLNRLNEELALSFEFDDIELARRQQEAFDKLLKRALANCAHIQLDEGYDIGLDEKNGTHTEGENALSTIVGANSANSPVENKGIKNNVFGIENLWQATNASGNCAFGFHSQWRATTANRNCGFGNETLDNNQDGAFNCAFGANAMKSELSNDWTIPVCINRNSAFGAWALYKTRGNDNNAFGFHSLRENKFGSNNLALGSYAGQNATGDREFYLDSLERGSNEEEKAKSLLYGNFDENMENQMLSVNAGLVFAPYLPTTDPHKKGALWIDEDCIKISRG